MAQQHLNGPISAYRVRWRAKAEMFSGLDGFVDSENTQLQLQLRDDRHRARRQNHRPPIGFVQPQAGVADQSWSQTPDHVRFCRFGPSQCQHGHASRSGLGLDAQRTAGSRHVRSVGGLIVPAFQKIDSGMRAGRPGFESPVAVIISPVAVVIMDHSWPRHGSVLAMKAAEACEFPAPTGLMCSTRATAPQKGRIDILHTPRPTARAVDIFVALSLAQRPTRS